MPHAFHTGSPWPRRIKPDHRVFLSGSWFMGLQQRNKESECVWSVQVNTLRRHFEKAPTGIKISSATPVKAALRSTREPFTWAEIHLPPVHCLPTCWSDFPSSTRLCVGVSGGIKRSAYVIDDMSWHKSKVMIFHQADNSAWMLKLCLVP